jgi:putative flippase GtrA
MIPQSLRYLVVVVAGLCVDLGLAIVLVKLGVSTWLASAVGLIGGAASNFFMHRYWTFQGAETQAMFPQLLSYAISVALILPVRLAVLAILSYLPLPIGPSLALVLATGVSFCVNFLVLKRLVFQRRH